MLSRNDQRWLVPLLLAITLLVIVASPALAANCLERVRGPYEKGNQVCVEVKNNCAGRTAVDWTMGTYQFGVYGTPIGTPQSSSVVIEPGKTAEICANKPAASGRYCFKFEVKNRDQTKPTDQFVRWLNDIRVAMLPGGLTPGTFTVGGSEELTEDVFLAVALVSAPGPGWMMDLSAYFVSVPEFPAEVAYQILAPPDAQDGDEAVFLIQAFGAESGEFVGDATIRAVIDPAAKPLGKATGANGDLAVTDGSGSRNDNPDSKTEEPLPQELPELNLTWVEEGTGEPVTGRTLLMAWDLNSETGDAPVVDFAYEDGGVWVPITDQTHRPHTSYLGTAVAVWDTNPLPAGVYRVQATMIDGNGNPLATERWIQVAKKPEAEAFGEVFGNELMADAAASFDPDGTIVDWRWDLGDGTVVSGPQVFHQYQDPTGGYPVTVTVTDDLGLESTAYCFADLGDATFACAKTCGCASMDIKDAGASNFNLPFLPAGNQRTLGGYNTIPQPPPAGGRGYQLGFSFEVEATLIAGSDPSLCTTGQWAKATATYGGRTTHPNGHPVSGDTLGPDNYTGNSSIQTTSAGPPPVIRWIDSPGWSQSSLSSATITGSGANGVSLTASFFAMVTGPAGTCSCSWDVEMKVNSNGTVATPPTLKNESCS